MSVLLTVYNEEKGIKRVLRYLSSQSDYLDDVVIVSDACRDRTDIILLRWLDRHEAFHKTVITRKERYGRGNAIKLGLSKCQNDVCAIMAGDIQPFPNSLPNLLSYFFNKKVGAVTGHPILLNGYRTVGDCLSHLMWNSYSRTCEDLNSRGEFSHLSGEMYAVRRSALRQEDEFNVMNEDAYIGHLIKMRGFHVVWAKDVTYLMMFPSGFWEWVKVRKRSCYGRVEMGRRTGSDGFIYQDLANREYLLNVVKSASSLKLLLSLFVGIPVELMLREYYKVSQPLPDPHIELWQPAKQTKW